VQSQFWYLEDAPQAVNFYRVMYSDDLLKCLIDVWNVVSSSCAPFELTLYGNFLFMRRMRNGILRQVPRKMLGPTNPVLNNTATALLQCMWTSSGG